MAEFKEEEFKFPDEVPAEPAEASTDWEIEIEDDTPEEDKGRKPADPEKVKALEVEVDELDKYSKDAKDKMIQMKRVWNDERRAKEAAERERQAAIEAAQRLLEENNRMKAMINSGQEEYKEAIKDSAEMQLKMAKKAYKDAYEAGDAEAMIEAQEAIAKATLKEDKVKNFNPKPLQEEKFDVQIQQQYQPAPRLDDKVVEWQENNPWFGQDEEMTAAALGLHEKLKRNGVKIGSDEYYATLDKTMRKRFPENFEGSEEVEVEQKEDAPKAKPKTVVAPATRSTASKKVKLKTSQVAIAKKLGLTPEQYVRELLKLEA
jgi:colicin import membrane protein